MSRTKHLLLIRLGAMGDLIHLSPTFAQIKRTLPHVTTHLLTSPMYKELAQTFPGLDHVWCWDPKGQNRLQALRRLFKPLRHAGIDGIVTLHSNLKWRILALAVLGLFGLRRFKVYRKEKVRGTGLEKRDKPRRHAIEDFYRPVQDLLGLQGLSRTEKNVLIPYLNLTGMSSRPTTSAMLGLIPGVGAHRPNRAWAYGHYVELVQDVVFSQPKVEVHLFGGPDDNDTCTMIHAQLAQRLPHVICHNHAGKHSILETAQHLSQCHLVVGGDTGPLHLAAAVGCRIVGVYGPTDVSRTGPVGPASTNNGVICITPETSYPYWPCESTDCQTHRSALCIEGIAPQNVSQQSQYFFNTY